MLHNHFVRKFWKFIWLMIPKINTFEDWCLQRKVFFNQIRVVNNFVIWLKKKNEKEGFSRRRRAIHCGSPAKDSLSFKTSFTAKFFDIKRKLFYFFHLNKTHFHMKGFTLGLIMKMRVSGTLKSCILSQLLGNLIGEKCVF